jgi:hypothetical protein
MGEERQMIFTPAIAIALSAPHFQLNYEVDGVSFNGMGQPATLHRKSMRYEYDAHSDATRTVMVEDGVKTIQTYRGKFMTWETINPDGTRHSETTSYDAIMNNLKPEALAFLKQISASSQKLEYRHVSNSAKTIAGIKCHKVVEGYDFKYGDSQDVRIENVQWEPLDPHLGKRITGLDISQYSVDGDDRKLTNGFIVTAIKLGKKPKR